MEHGYKAAELFLQGYNCAQAVAVAFCDVTGLTEEFSAKMASYANMTNYVTEMRKIYMNVLKGNSR